MISIDLFMIGLMVVSVLTGVVTEAIKKMLAGVKVNYHANIISGVVAVILSAAVGVAYVFVAGVGFTALSIVAIVSLAFMSWLSAMVGYDKVVQIIDQLKTVKKG